MVVVIRNEERPDMPAPFTGRDAIQIQQTSAEAVFVLFFGEEEDLLRAFTAVFGFLLTCDRYTQCEKCN